MKNLVFAIVLLCSHSISAQNALDSLRADALNEAANALRRGDQDEATIFISLATERGLPSTKSAFYDALNSLLDMHIKWETRLKPTAIRIKERFSTKKF